MYTLLDANAARPLIRPFEDQQWADVLPGEKLTVRVHASEVGGKFSILENIAEHGAATPLHTHLEDEVFHLLEGEVVFSLDGKLSTVGEGSVVLVPGGTPHAWRNRSGKPVHMMAFFSPGGIEDLFGGIAGRSPDEIVEIAARFGTIVTGPPIPEG